MTKESSQRSRSPFGVFGAGCVGFLVKRLVEPNKMQILMLEIIATVGGLGLLEKCKIHAKYSHHAHALSPFPPKIPLCWLSIFTSSFLGCHTRDKPRYFKRRLLLLYWHPALAISRHSTRNVKGIFRCLLQHRLLWNIGKLRVGMGTSPATATATGAGTPGRRFAPSVSPRPNWSAGVKVWR